MRRLFLLRHAEAAPPEGGQDFERPLSERGRAAAERLGRYLARENLRPDLALVSSARRTRETWAALDAALGGVPARVERVIYESGRDGLLAEVAALDGDKTSVIVVGHNPGIEDLARLLVGSAQPTARAQMLQSFPPAALAVIDFDMESWDGIQEGKGHLERFLTPASLEAGTGD